MEALRRDVADLSPSLHFRDIDLLPRICPAQEVKRKRDGSLATTYTGVVHLDVEKIGSPQEAEAIKAKAAAWPTTLATFMGSSGRTVKILVRGTLDDGTTPTKPEHINAFHTRLYEETARVYSTLLQRTLRPRQPKPQDCFRWTYDPTAYYNGNAMPVRLSLSDLASNVTPDNEAAHEYGPTSNIPSAINNSNARRRFATAFEETQKKYAGAELTPAAELNATAAEAYTEGLPLEETIRQAYVSMHWHDLGIAGIREAVESVYTELASKGKSAEKRSMQSISAQLQAFMSAHYDLRYNELTNGVEWRQNNSSAYTFLPLDSRVMNTMIQACHDNGIEVFDRDMKRYLGSTRIRNYNVALAYLSEVRGQWDGTTDYIGALADRVPCRNPNWREWFHTWFLGMVAQWMGMGSVYGNAVVPLLIGPQGCGKSTFGQLILPPELREAGYRELVDFSSKLEAERMLSTSLLINLDEFNQISEKTQQGFLKNLIQKSSIKGRRPYSSVTQNMQRYASFVATTNLADALSDPSGSRRYIIADILNGTIIDNKPAFYYTEVYAQALSEIESGRLTYFTPDEVNKIENYNSTYVNMKAEVRQFLDVFELATEVDAGATKRKVSDIAKIVYKQTGFKYSKSDIVNLGHWLTAQARCGRVTKTTANGTAVYLVREIQNDEGVE